MRLVPATHPEAVATGAVYRPGRAGDKSTDCAGALDGVRANPLVWMTWIRDPPSEIGPDRAIDSSRSDVRGNPFRPIDKAFNKVMTPVDLS